jgi:hypothetical protein
MHIQYDDINDPIHFCLDTILKEAREEGRLVKQIFYTMLSAYTNNPLNLAINAPSGEGKTYVIQKVGERFPKEDIVFLAAMTDKALFHRQGILVTKNEAGEYEPLEKKIAEIDSEIEDKESQIAIAKDNNLKQGLKSQIKDLEKQKDDLRKNAKKLIDLSRKVLVFLDSPRPELFGALMPLLSHDRYEVEYEFVDTHNGIRTRSNILRGWPAVIFAQAIDYSRYPRYSEIQRRFIMTNPKMNKEKYEQAVDLICDKYGLPDFAYQAKIVKDSDKEKVREIIYGIKERILDVCGDRIAPGKNNVVIPFQELLKKLLPKDKAFDMTTAIRFASFLSLLSFINIDKRPRIVIRKEGDVILQTIPFALFEDLKEAVFLMEYASGVRPYQLEWYNDIFLEMFNKKTVPDSREKDNKLMTEKRIGVTTEQLIEKTAEVNNRHYTTKQILDTYIYPLINQGYIDKTQSELDKRSNIYYPVIATKSKNIKLFENDSSNNLSQQNKLIVEDPTIYPSKEYLISKIQEVLRYSKNNDLIVIKIKDHEGNEISVEELVERYYKDPQGYFELGSSTIPENPSPDQSLPTIEEGKSEQQLSSIERQEEQKENNNSDKQEVLEEYLGNVQTANVLQGTFSKNAKTIKTEHNTAKKLFDPEQTNNLIYSDVELKYKEDKQPSVPSTIASSTGETPSPSPQLQEQEYKRFNCFYCDQAYSSDKERIKHIDYEHPGKLYYPTPEDFEKRLL